MAPTLVQSGEPNVANGRIAGLIPEKRRGEDLTFIDRLDILLVSHGECTVGLSTNEQRRKRKTNNSVIDLPPLLR